MFFAVIARDRPSSGGDRQRLSDRHLAYLKSLGGKVLFAGALFDDHDEKDGSLMVVETASLEEARRLAAGDPFVAEGLYQSYEVRRWSFGVNNLAARLGQDGDRSG